MAITPGGRVGDDSSLDSSPKKNWVENAGGLPKYIRMVAHAMMRKGHAKDQAIRLAVGIVRNWATGQGEVSPKVRAAAVKAVAEWEAKKASTKVSKASTTSWSLGDYQLIVKQLEADSVIEKIRRVRTIEGVKFFGKPIGTPITPGMVADAKKKHGEKSTEAQLLANRRSAVRSEKETTGNWGGYATGKKTSNRPGIKTRTDLAQERVRQHQISTRKPVEAPKAPSPQTKARRAGALSPAVVEALSRAKTKQEATPPVDPPKRDLVRPTPKNRGDDGVPEMPKATSKPTNANIRTSIARYDEDMGVIERWWKQAQAAAADGEMLDSDVTDEFSNMESYVSDMEAAGADKLLVKRYKKHYAQVEAWWSAQEDKLYKALVDSGVDVDEL